MGRLRGVGDELGDDGSEQVVELGRGFGGTWPGAERVHGQRRS